MSKVIGSSTGLSEVEMKVFMAILNSNELSVSEIQRLCSLSKPTIYSSLKKLRSLNLITPVGGKPLKFRVESVKPIMKLLKKALEDANNEIREYMKWIEDAWEKKTLSCSTKRKTIVGGLFLDRDEALHKLANLILNAKKEIYLSGARVWLLEELKPYLLKAKRKGVRLKLTLSDESFIPKQLKELSPLEPEYHAPNQNFFQFNGEEFENSLGFIDRCIFINIYFKGKRFFLEYLNSPRCASCIINFMEKVAEINRKKPVLKGELPREAVILIQALKQGYCSKREISLKTGLSGSKINQAISILTEKGIVKVFEEKTGRGRPKTIITLIKEI